MLKSIIINIFLQNILNGGSMMADLTDDQLIIEANKRKEFRTIVNMMSYFAENPKGEVGYWGQPIDLYKKTRALRENKEIDQDYSPVNYVNKRGRSVKFEKYKKICVKEILNKLKQNPDITTYLYNGKTLADYAMDADMHKVFCKVLENPTLPKLIKTTDTNVFMRAILNQKPEYYQKLLEFPELIVDQDIHGRTALTLAIQNVLTDDFIKNIVNADPRILSLMCQKQNPAMIMLGMTKHINSGIVFKNEADDKQFVQKYFDFIMRATLKNPQACTQTDEKGQNIADILVKEGYSQLYQDIASNPNILSNQKNEGKDIVEAIKTKDEKLGRIAEDTFMKN